MHSFHHSRGRILFEVLCAFTTAGFLVGAWQQTGASALIGGAVVAALYGIAHVFDLRSSRQIVEVEQTSEDVPIAGEPEEELLQATTNEPPPVVAAIAVEPLAELADISPETEPEMDSHNVAPDTEPAAAPPPELTDALAKAKQKKSRRQTSRRPSKSSKGKGQGAVEASHPEPQIEPREDRLPPTPLFEIDPYVRQLQRAQFGRKTG